MAKPYILRRVKNAAGVLTVYCYHKTTGKRIPLPGTPGFDEAFRQAGIRTAPKEDEPTLAGAIAHFRLAERYQNYKRNSRSVFNYAMGKLAPWHHKPLANFNKDDLRSIRAKYIATPAASNTALVYLQSLLVWASGEGLVEKWRLPDFNKDLQLPTGHFPTWEPEAIETFLTCEAVPADTRLGFVIGLCTGQRVGDLVAMQWKHYDGELLYVKQGKTGTEVWVPVHTDLKQVLDTAKRGAPDDFIIPLARCMPRLETRKIYFQKALMDARLAAGLGKASPSCHGLRKAAACMLFEMGCGATEIMSILGHSTLTMVELYIRDARKIGLAMSAAQKVRDARNVEHRYSGVQRALIRPAAAPKLTLVVA